MKALSVRQPWAKNIAKGIKTIELRSWKTKFRGQFLLVSSAKADDWMKKFGKNQDAKEGIWHEVRDLDDDIKFNDYYLMGKALAIVELVDITPFSREHAKASLCDWQPGLYAWHLKVIKEIEPFPVKGQLNFYNVEY